MKIPTFKNVDHSSGKEIVGAMVNTYTPATGSTENIEMILTQIYKEVCAKNATIEVNIPEIKIPNIYIPNINIPSLDQPSIFNEVKVNPTPIMLEVKAYNWLIITNMIVSILALAVAIYSMRH